MTKGSKSIKVIIDTNVWISFLIGKSLKGIQNYLDNGVIKIVVCQEQLIELNEVFKRPKFQKYFSKVQVKEFFELLEECSVCIDLTTKVNDCRDLKDNYLLSLVIDSKADYLITGDSDLLVLNPYKSTKILNYSDFKKEISL